jgi:hypothetical protein
MSNCAFPGVDKGGGKGSIVHMLFSYSGNSALMDGRGDNLAWGITKTEDIWQSG